MNQAKIKLLIPRTVKNKIDDYINLTNGEISGLGDVEKVEDGVFRITEVYIYRQTCTAASTSIENTAIHDFIVDRLAAGGSVENVKLWWHSHAKMGVFWSSTDEGAIQNIENDYLISLVQNHAGDIKTRIDLFKPFRATVHDLEVVIEENEAAQAEVAIEPFTEGAVFSKFIDVAVTLRNTFGQGLGAATMEHFKEAFKATPDTFRMIAGYLKAYADIIDNEYKDHLSGLIKDRQIPIKAEIDEKVKFSSYTSYGSGYPYYSGGHHSSGKGGKHKSKSRFSGGLYDYDDDYYEGYGYGHYGRRYFDEDERAMDDLPGFDKGKVESFKRALDRDDNRDLKRGIIDTKTSTQVAIPKVKEWRNALKMGNNGGK